ncbi:hypothetical protein, partial [Desulfobotulus alkaliphilus]|uniref:hypothetical protein n=1 Tax=Desulfobotulus alkaliphilus TaxID=622671 RepID=UPI001C977623
MLSPHRLFLHLSVLVCMALLFFCPEAFARTEVRGQISTDTTWTVAGSPYIITGTVVVRGKDGDDGVTTLTIEPGVELRFNANTRLDVGGSSGDPGALIAAGTADAPIRFTANSADPKPGHWNGIRFLATAQSTSR